MVLSTKDWKSRNKTLSVAGRGSRVGRVLVVVRKWGAISYMHFHAKCQKWRTQCPNFEKFWAKIK